MKNALFFYSRLIVTGLLVLVCSNCSKPVPPRTDMALGTVCTINLFEQGSEKRYDALFSRLDEIEAFMSANRENSTIGRINAAAGIRPVSADRETLEVLDVALRFAEQSAGRFDPTIGPLVKLWDIGGTNPAVPEPGDIHTARTLIDWRKVVINRQAETVYLPEKGMRLDLGAIAKGYAADELAKMIRGWGIKRGMIDLGGNIFALGNKKAESPWHIGIRDPEESGGASVLSLYISDASMVTSGINERFFIDNGKRYHHILDPETGYPADTDMLSVSILSPSSMEADALSTTLFLLGIPRGLEYIETVPDVEAVFIDKSHKVYPSSGLSAKLQIRNPRYSLAGN